MPHTAIAGINQHSTFTIVGGLFENNVSSSVSGDGMYIGARNVTVVGAIAKKNGRHGFHVESRAIDTLITGCLAIANSQTSAGTYYGFSLVGNGGQLSNCRAIGVDSDEVDNIADYAGLTVYHQRGFGVSPSATGQWILNTCRSTYHTVTNPANGVGMASSAATTATVLILDQTGIVNPMTNGVHGSPGSTYILTGGTNEDEVRWIRVSGAPGTSLDGWKRMAGGIPKRAALPTAAAQYKGQMMLKDNAGVSDDALHVCIQTSSGYAWRQVTLT